MKTSLTKRFTMYTVSLALFMDVLDTNIINTAIPTMARNFHVNPVDLKIALISYLLSLAVFIPISGWTADKYGTKRVFVCALGLFTLSSFICGYSQNLFHLVIGRSIQGIGGAFMISVGRLIIARSFERHQLVEAMNTVIIVVSMAVMLGPFLGGLIVEHFSWPWIFWVNIPAGLLAIALAIYVLKDNTARQARPFDFLGFFLFGGSLSLLCFSLAELSETGIELMRTMSLICVSLIMLAICILHAKKQLYPIININLFRFRTFRISVFGNLCTRLSFGGIPFLLPLLHQVDLGFSAQLSGLLLVPIALGIICSKLVAFRILRILGYRRYLMINTVLVGLVLAAFQIITKGTSVYVIACLTFLFGICTAAQYTAMNSLAFSEISSDDLSASTSITSTTQILAQTLGVAVGALFLRVFATFELSGLLTTTVFHRTFLALSVLTVLSVLIFLQLKWNDGEQMLVEGVNVGG